MSTEIPMTPIGWIESVYKEKFGTPRQSGVVPSATGILHFYPPFNQPDAFTEIEGFSDLWLITHFHLIPEEEFRAQVRPPKLGGAQKVGVFASRSPFRPNRLCLSRVKLREVQRSKDGVSLLVSGLDVVHGTPLLDVKPYLPYADAEPLATTSYGLAPAQTAVRPDTQDVFSEVGEEMITLITETLQAHPQPAYAKEAQSFGLSLAGYNIRWTLQGETIIIKKVEKE